VKTILVICPYTVIPPSGGGKMAVFYRCQELARHYRLLLLCPEDEQSPRHTGDPAPFEKIIQVPRRHRARHPALDYLARSWFSTSPSSSSYLGPEAGVRMVELVREHQIDLLLLEHFYSAVHLFPFLDPRSRPGVGIIEQNVEHHVWLDQVKFGQIHPVMRLTARLEAMKLRRQLGPIYRRADGIAFISEKDRQEVAALCPHPNFHTCNVILPAPAETKSDFGGTGRICYWGGLGYFPNLEGLIWFTQEVWPMVLQQKPDAQLVIFDELASKRAKAGLAHTVGQPGISFVGHLPKEEMNRIALECDGFISPIRLGSGIKLKNTVAMSLGLPIVATSSSMAGNYSVPGRDYLLADTSEDFAARVLEILGSSSLRESLARGALAAFREHYSAEKATAGWLRFVESCRPR
jgi:glycosyltransferase involved in cell wall biosynthesis